MPTVAYVNIQRLLVECPASLRAAFTTPALPPEWFEVVGGIEYLRLWCDRSKYTRIVEGQDLNFVDTLATSVAPIATARIGFEATIEEENADQLYLLSRIARSRTSSDLRTYNPLTVLDFVRPEDDDRIAAEGNAAYTIRKGRIISIQEAGGMVGYGSQLYNKGYTFRFLELNKRRLI